MKLPLPQLICLSALLAAWPATMAAFTLEWKDANPKEDNVYSAYRKAPQWTPKVFGWEGLQTCLTTQQAAMILQPKLGPPLIVMKARRSLYETWTYDNGGSLLFVRGLLDSWTIPSVIHPAPVKTVSLALN
jgi:hypothetical protein